MIPGWLAKKRHETCLECAKQKGCADKITLLADVPSCSLNHLHPLGDELRWAKAWPDNAPRASGCCDSALHPAS
jgi:hypothetical protein